MHHSGLFYILPDYKQLLHLPHLLCLSIRSNQTHLHATFSWLGLFLTSSACDLCPRSFSCFFFFNPNRPSSCVTAQLPCNCSKACLMLTLLFICNSSSSKMSLDSVAYIILVIMYYNCPVLLKPVKADSGAWGGLPLSPPRLLLLGKADSLTL